MSKISEFYVACDDETYDRIQDLLNKLKERVRADRQYGTVKKYSGKDYINDVCECIYHALYDNVKHLGKPITETYSLEKFKKNVNSGYSKSVTAVYDVDPDIDESKMFSLVDKDDPMFEPTQFQFIFFIIRTQYISKTRFFEIYESHYSAWKEDSSLYDKDTQFYSEKTIVTRINDLFNDYIGIKGEKQDCFSYLFSDNMPRKYAEYFKMPDIRSGIEGVLLPVAFVDDMIMSISKLHYYLKTIEDLKEKNIPLNKMHIVSYQFLASLKRFCETVTSAASFCCGQSKYDEISSAIDANYLNDIPIWKSI